MLGVFNARLQFENFVVAVSSYPQIEARTLVIHASGDAAIPVSAGRDLAATIPGARFEIVEGGHMPGDAGQARRVRELTAAFLAEGR